MNLEVESADVIKLILQFCKEHNLTNTVKALQDESHVSLNTVDNLESFTSDILNGRWDNILALTSTLSLPASKLIDLYEQIVLELAELRELDTARALLRQTAALQTCKNEQPERYLRLEHLLQRTYFDYNVAYAGVTKEKRRQNLANALRTEVFTVPPSRLTSLLNQSLKWQQHVGALPKGSHYDLFRGQIPSQEVQTEEKVPTKMVKTIKFGSKSHPECARFSPDGLWLVSGSIDGYLEVWDYETGKLSKELKYQANDDIMQHDSTVLALCFSNNTELLGSASVKGEIKVWQLSTGLCVRKFTAAHGEGITALEFTRDGTQILSSSFDTTVRLHGLKSGRMLKEFRGHTSFVNSVTFTEDNATVISASNDGTIKLWDAKSTDCIKTLKVSQAQMPSPIYLCTRMIGHPDRLLVVDRSNTLRMITLEGHIVQTYTSTTASQTTASGDGTTAAAAPKPVQLPSAPGASTEVTEKQKAASVGVKSKQSGAAAQNDFIYACMSPTGHYAYAITEECILHCFETDTGKLLHAMKVHKDGMLGVSCHPHRSLLATYSQDSTIKLWKPA